MVLRNIVVDIGNTRIKSGEFENDRLIEVKVWDRLEDIFPFYNHLPHNWGVCNVRNNENELKKLFNNSTVLISHTSKFPISLDYKTPESLGIDRLMGVIGAQELYPQKSILVIDLGSCITYDFLSKEGVYKGGAIAPGLKMRMKSMNVYTSKLPDISNEWQNYLVQGLGKSTAECLVKGTFDAIILEMNGFIKLLEKDFNDLTVILTGGDAHSFESKLKQPIFADPNLILRGINRTLNHNK